MPWIDVKNRLPKKEGIYLVQFNWSENVKAIGQVLFKDGKFDEHEILKKSIGEIIRWMERDK